MPRFRLAIWMLTLTPFVTACDRDNPLVIETPVLDALAPEVERLTGCAVDLADGFRAALIREDTVRCVVAVARNQAAILDRAKGA